MCCCGCVWRVSPGGYARHESGRAINLFVALSSSVHMAAGFPGERFVSKLS